jgi:hypothetical protein
MEERPHILADAILVLHAMVVCFIILALPVIWIGYFRDWRFVRNIWFRLTHLLLIGIVAAESIFGMMCPLTTWEAQLRSGPGQETTYQDGFISHWLHQVLFYDIPPKYFLIAYVLFFLVVLGTFLWVKPSVGGAKR